MNGDELFRAAVDQDDDDDDSEGGYWPLLIVFSDGALNANGRGGALLLAWIAFASFVTLAWALQIVGAVAWWLAGVAAEHLGATGALIAVWLLGAALGVLLGLRSARRGQRA